MRETALGILTAKRSEQERQLRKIRGDIGAKFSKSKVPTLRSEVCGTITSVLKDNLLLTIWITD